MTKITIKQSIVGRFWQPYNLDFFDGHTRPVEQMMDGPAIQHSKTQATFDLGDGVVLQINGTRLKFAEDGHLIKGTVTKLTYLDHDAEALVATGLSLNAGTARTKYNHFESYPVDAHPVFAFSATGVTTPVRDDFGVLTLEGVAFTGWDGNDTIKGSPFDDYLLGMSGNDKIKGLDGNDLIDGMEGNDKLSGGKGDDELVGSTGNDTLDGGPGDDWATIGVFARSSSTAALKIDLNKGVATSSAFGTDKLISIENVIGNSGNDKFIGNDAGNTFIGYFGKDSLDGGGGNDRLYGDVGHDTLKGGAGADTFAFDIGAADADHVKDFKSGIDKIELDTGRFASLESSLDPRPLSDANFVLGTDAGDADDYFIYDKSKGKLYYDADGSGSGSKELLGTFDNKADLHASDFQIVLFGPGFWF